MEILHQITLSRKYKYKPITEPDGIRLIELHPSLDPSTVIRCSLVYTSISLYDNQDIYCHYTALSYIWGNPEKIKAILVDGRSLKITANLFSALKDLRHQTIPLLLWVDGICINQKDNEEKGMQIRLMGQIYASALHTVLYLGPADTESDEVRCLSTIRQGSHVDMERLSAAIFGKEWFTRVWVFQELVFSINPWLQCGKTRVKWHEVFSTLSGGQLERLENPKYKIAFEMLQAWKSHHGSLQEDRFTVKEAIPINSMIKLLQARRGLGISDPRDMVFAHVGFAIDGRHEDLTIDYTKTCAKVYTDFARYIVNNHGIITLLDCVGESTSPTRMKGLASWVPDWTIPVATSPYLSRYTQDYPLPRIPLVWIQESIPTFNVGLRDTVLSVSSPLGMEKITPETRQRMSSTLDSMGFAFNEPMAWFQVEVSVDYRSDIMRVWPEVYEIWREVVSDNDILPREPIDLYLETERDHMLISPRQRLNVPLLLILVFHKNYGPKYIEGRALAKTSSGRLAAVPDSTQKGDIIANFYVYDDSTLPRRFTFQLAREFVFSPLQPVDKHRDVDAEILKWTDEWRTLRETPLKGVRRYRSRNDDPILQCTVKRVSHSEGLDKSERPCVVQCRFVGDCFLDTYGYHIELQENIIALY